MSSIKLTQNGNTQTLPTLGIYRVKEENLEAARQAAAKLDQAVLEARCGSDHLFVLVDDSKLNEDRVGALVQLGRRTGSVEHQSHGRFRLNAEGLDTFTRYAEPVTDLNGVKLGANQRGDAFYAAGPYTVRELDTDAIAVSEALTSGDDIVGRDSQGRFWVASSSQIFGDAPAEGDVITLQLPDRQERVNVVVTRSEPFETFAAQAKAEPSYLEKYLARQEARQALKDSLNALEGLGQTLEGAGAAIDKNTY